MPDRGPGLDDLGFLQSAEFKSITAYRELTNHSSGDPRWHR